MRAARNNTTAAVVTEPLTADAANPQTVEAEVPTQIVGETQPEVAKRTIAEITLPLSKGDYSSVFFPVRQAEVEIRRALIAAAEANRDKDLVITISHK